VQAFNYRPYALLHLAHNLRPVVCHMSHSANTAVRLTGNVVQSNKGSADPSEQEKLWPPQSDGYDNYEFAVEWNLDALCQLRHHYWHSMASSANACQHMSFSAQADGPRAIDLARS
jgi:hypothetical protein